jgi:hypothetical protein
MNKKIDKKKIILGQACIAGFAFEALLSCKLVIAAFYGVLGFICSIPHMALSIVNAIAKAMGA